MKSIQLVLFLASGLLISSCNDLDNKSDEDLGSLLPELGNANVLVISFDAMRADVLGTYGYQRPTSPRLDAFAENALVLDNAYTAAPVTPTSFASAFTGQYPYRVFLGWKLIPTTTLAQIMNDAGFYTFGLFNNIQLVETRNFNQGFESYQTGTTGDKEWIDLARQQISSVADRKFFGWVHFISPHTPYDFREMSAHLAGPQTQGRYALGTKGKLVKEDIESDDELRRVRDLYDGEVFYADSLFGELMDHMDKLGLLENTVIIVTADHGEEFMEHGHLQHKSLYQEVIRIPMMIHHPKMAQGHRTNTPYLNVDLLPIVAFMAGLPVPSNIDGIGLNAPLRSERGRIITGMTAKKQRNEIAFERNGTKLIQICRPELREELYDLSTDPLEKQDLILEQPAMANGLFDSLLEKTITEPCVLIRNSSQGSAPEDLLTSEQIEQLKSLGYIQ